MGTMAIDHPMPNTTAGGAGFEHGPWVHGLCGCTSDIPSCLMSWCCPCIIYGQNYEQIHKDGCLMQGLIFAILMSCGLSCLVHMNLRANIRNKFNIIGGQLGDFLVTCCCPCCALAQESREITHRRHEAASKGINW